MMFYYVIMFDLKVTNYKFEKFCRNIEDFAIKNFHSDRVRPGSPLVTIKNQLLLLK